MQSFEKLPPLILTPTPSHNYLAYRGNNTVLKLPDESVEWLNGQRACDGGFSEQFLELFRSNWGLDASEMMVKDAIHFREKSSGEYTDASYEINLACNYNCEHCYLDERKNRKLGVEERAQLLDTMQKAGVVRLHISGGEPLIDKHFAETYMMAQRAGFLLRISSNGYALSNENILNLLKEHPPIRIAVSLYGATAESYEGLTRTAPGTFEKFKRSMQAASDAGLNVR
ncbi:MAG: hypothetical protein C0508_28170, partial [Cyanobacteria bacterium PR.023]|nr:hypothetical protein [Cyanobacteria bacterium PR.023]